MVLFRLKTFVAVILSVNLSFDKADYVLDDTGFVGQRPNAVLTPITLGPCESVQVFGQGCHLSHT